MTMTAEQMDELEAAATAYFENNIAVVAMHEKTPLVSWMRWQENPQSLNEFQNQPWARATGFAVVCGSKTRDGLYLCVVDVDSPDFDLALARTTATERTPHGGFHFIYHSKSRVKGQKDLERHVELLGQGNLCVMCPSLGYQRLNDNCPSMVDDVAEEYAKLVHALGGTPKHEAVSVTTLLKGVAVGQRDNSAIILATFYRKKGMSQSETLMKLEDWNMKNAEPLSLDVLNQKVQSAYSTSEPYHYRFNESNEEAEAFPEIPAPIPYESAEKLEQELLDYVKERVDFTHDEEYAVFVAAVKLSWVLERFDSCPYLFFYAPKRSGKTRALKLMEQLCYRGFLALNATRATIYYLVDQYTPTLLLDETEVYTTNDPEAKEIQCLLNSGYQRGGKVMRLEPDQHGKRHLRFWKVFCLKALAGTRFVSDTLEDRCIVFNMIKNSYPVKPLDEQQARTFRGKLAAWRNDILKQQPDVPDVVDVSYVVPTTTMTTNDMNDDEINNVHDDRLRELFNPLILVSGETQKRLIRKKCLQVQKVWDDDARLSFDAEVLVAIGSVAKTADGRFTSGSVTDTVNCGRREDEKIEARTVGWLIKRLGFSKAPALEGKARSWRYDQQLWAKRSKQYGLEAQLKLDESSTETEAKQ